ncbi:MAG TPA: response regulator transcription factor [Candidatus Limnocylindrales bacterium]|nr:response regulator transcription factor [Candidatus Limnocylindrales bacterium]
MAVIAERASAVRARILVVDDEERMRSVIARALAQAGYAVEAVPDGEAALRLARGTPFDLVILDLLMPGLDGQATLRRLLECRPRPSILILSALSDSASKVETLELGADDYVAKPFSLDELIARVKVRLRAARPDPNRLTVGRVSLDEVRRRADAGGGPVVLAEREFLLLRELMRHAGQTLSKERLLASVWGYHFDPGSNVVDVYVRRLRSKLGYDLVTTIRGEGYRLDGD